MLAGCSVKAQRIHRSDERLFVVEFYDRTGVRRAEKIRLPPLS